MADERVEATLIIGVDEAKAKSGAGHIKTIKENLKGAEEQAQRATQALNRMAETGEKLRNVGTLVAGMGTAMIAPFAAAAQVYATRFKDLEANANSYLRAQQRSIDATASLGRVATTVLTPALNQVANVTEKIAAFAQAHPELVRAAVNTGSALAVAGGTLAALGTATSMLARIQQIASSGGLVGTLTSSIVYIGAFAAGLKIGEVGLQAFGKATGNAQLAGFNLAKALETARQLLMIPVLKLAEMFVEAKKTVGELADIIDGVAALVKNKFEQVMDNLATGFRMFLIAMDKFAVDLYNATIAKLPGKSEIVYKEGASPEERLAAEEAGLRKRQADRDAELSNKGQQLANNQTERNQQYQEDRKNLEKLANWASNFASTGSLGPGVDKVIKDFTDKVNGFLNTPGKGITTNGAALPPEAVRAYLDYRKGLAQSDKQYNLDLANAKRGFEQEEAKAQKDHQAALLDADREQYHAEQDLAKRHQEESEKATRDFLFQEKQIQEKANLDRLIRQKQHDARLSDLTASRDVAGFVQEMRNYALQEDANQKQQDLEKSQRLEKFQNDQKERGIQYGIELEDLKTQGRRKREQLEEQFRREESERRTAYQNQLNDLKRKHDQERQQLLTAFATQLADLSGNIAGLKGIQSAYYADATVAAQNFVNQNKAILQQLYGASIGATNTYTSNPQVIASNSYSTSTRTSPTSGVSLSSSPAPNRYAARSYDRGIDFLPSDGWVYAHRGERITPAEQNVPGGNTYHITVQNTVGDVASKSMLDAAIQDIATGIQRTIGAY